MQQYISLACILWILLAATACSTQEYGQCTVQDDLKIMFKPKSNANLFSHSFCIVCNPSLSPEEYGEWALEMGAPQAPSSTDGLLPCLYVYPGSDSFEECAAHVCEQTATYNDMVSEENGNFNLDPLFDPNTEFVTVNSGN